ncbi:hypothetical protein AB1M95_15005 [Sulfitobacter sp. LCG007]
MKYWITAVMLGIGWAGTAAAQSVLDRLQKGVSEAAEAAKGVASSVEDSLVSTEEMISNEATPEETRLRIDATADAALERLFAETPSARDLFELSAGYAVFDARRVTLIGISGGYGRGVAVSRETGTRTYMKMGTGGLGLALGVGGFDRKIIILFETEFGFLDFVQNGYDATAEAGSMFGEEKAEQAVRFVDGRSVFVLTKKGWKISAHAAGTRYWRDGDLN